MYTWFPLQTVNFFPITQCSFASFRSYSVDFHFLSFNRASRVVCHLFVLPDLILSLMGDYRRVLPSKLLNSVFPLAFLVTQLEVDMDESLVEYGGSSELWFVVCISIIRPYITHRFQEIVLTQTLSHQVANATV